MVQGSVNPFYNSRVQVEQKVKNHCSKNFDVSNVAT